ncbi:MAG: ATP-binding protein [Deltaproteobacteria bacterium]|nr:ATP-binding protein [Deltaproteobacteria bacterium]
MKPRECREPHERRRIVLTGGPGAGKTAVLELIRQYFCLHVRVLPEAAGVVFGGGFPREASEGGRRAAQRAIYYIQRELEAVLADADNTAIVLCDRGTVDGAAYWPGPESLWASVASTHEAELARYDAVIHLRTPPLDGGYNQQNPLRIESAVEAAAIDLRIAREWEGHPRRFVVEATPDFLAKGRRALSILREELPACCREHVVTPLEATT